MFKSIAQRRPLASKKLLAKLYSTSSTVESSGVTIPSPTLDYDVKAERKQNKKDMRGLSDKFNIPPSVGIDDEFYIRAKEILEQQQQDELDSNTLVSSSLEIEKEVVFDQTHPKNQPHHNRKKGLNLAKGSLITNVNQEPSKDTTIDEE